MALRDKGGAALPVQAVGLHGWDGDKWEQLILSGGSMAVNLTQVNGVEQTGDDWTQRFMALNDDSVTGLMRSLGDAGASPTNAPGRTVLQLLDDIETAINNTPTDQWNPQSVSGNGTAPFSVDLDTGTTGGRGIVCINVTNASAGSNFTVYGSIDGTNYVDLFSGSVPAVGGQYNDAFENAYRYLRISVTSVSGGTTYATIAATR